MAGRLWPGQVSLALVRMVQVRASGGTWTVPNIFPPELPDRLYIKGGAGRVFKLCVFVVVC